jgi:hypothetical protein
MPSTSLQQATKYISIYTTKHIYVIRNNLNNRSSIYREGERTSVVKVNWSQGRVAEGIGVREEDDTGAGGVRGGGAPELEECMHTLEERTTMQQWRECTTAVGGELKRFGRKESTRAGIYLYYSNISTPVLQLEPLLISQ